MSLQIRSLVKEGTLQVSLLDVADAPLAADDVRVRVEAAPVNPSDLGLLFGAADMRTAKLTGSGALAVLTAEIPEHARKAMQAREGQSLPVGNEGAGTVVEAGAAAQALLGKQVTISGGAMYAQTRTVKAAQCLVLPAGTTVQDGASSFVNPITALGMVETMRAEGHSALVHTAAASALGQMLVKICLKDGVPLVNIVRKKEQVALLKSLGAQHVVDSSTPTFANDLVEALAATKATIAFDALGGGTLGSQILSAMETVLTRDAKVYNRYGSPVHKQLYLYGGLDTRMLELDRSYGMRWGVGGWIMFAFIEKMGAQGMARLQARIAAELTTTFATHYAKEISFAQLLDPKEIAAYSARGTGGKYLLKPNAAL